jgi:hypothetical protein
VIPDRGSQQAAHRYQQYVASGFSGPVRGAGLKALLGDPEALCFEALAKPARSHRTIAGHIPALNLEHRSSRHGQDDSRCDLKAV